jgi:hypothetical protein
VTSTPGTAEELENCATTGMPDEIYVSFRGNKITLQFSTQKLWVISFKDAAGKKEGTLNRAVYARHLTLSFANWPTLFKVSSLTGKGLECSDFML